MTYQRLFGSGQRLRYRQDETRLGLKTETGKVIRPLAKVGGRGHDGAALRIARAGQSAANVVVG